MWLRWSHHPYKKQWWSPDKRVTSGCALTWYPLSSNALLPRNAGARRLYLPGYLNEIHPHTLSKRHGVFCRVCGRCGFLHEKQNYNQTTQTALLLGPCWCSHAAGLYFRHPISISLHFFLRNRHHWSSEIIVDAATHCQSPPLTASL